MTSCVEVEVRAARTTRSAAFDGVRDMTPMVIGVVPFGIAIGATVASSSVDPWVGLASGPVVLAGAAQLATLQMLQAGSAPIVIVVSALLINLRLLVYGASLARWFGDARLRTRLLLAIPVIDQTHFVCVPRFERGDLDLHHRIAYYAGAGGWLVTAWLGSQALTVVLGASLPASVRLDMAAPLALVGLLAKSTLTRPAVAAGSIGVTAAAIGAGLPYHAATLVAIVAGMVVAVGVESRVARPYGGRR